MRYFIRLSYSGTLFNGWQIQPGLRTVQGELDQCLTHLLGENVHVMGAGRTDTGVHARLMYAHMEVENQIKNCNALVKRMNRYLGADIAIYEVFAVKDDAHARFSATSRGYEYHIYRSKDPFQLGLSYLYDLPLDVQKMQQAADIIKKNRDFAAFAKNFSVRGQYLCHVQEARWEERADGLVFYIRANRFVYNMVRSIVGTMLMVGQGKIELSEVDEIIHSRRRSSAGTSAPAHGLYLVEVEYPNSIRI